MYHNPRYIFYKNYFADIIKSLPGDKPKSAGKQPSRSGARRDLY